MRFVSAFLPALFALLSMKPEEYPAPVKNPSDPASVLEPSGSFGPVLPPLAREAVVKLDGPCAEGSLLPVEGASKSGPFYHLAGIAGGDLVSVRLEVVPYGLLSRDYEVRENGTPVGTIEYRPLHLREKGMVTANGREYVVLREGVLRASYLLRAADGAIRARAERKGWAASAYLLLSDVSQILLRKKMLAMRETYLLSWTPRGKQVPSSERAFFPGGWPSSCRKTPPACRGRFSFSWSGSALMIHRKDSADSAGPSRRADGQPGATITPTSALPRAAGQSSRSPPTGRRRPASPRRRRPASARGASGRSPTRSASHSCS